MFKNKKIKFSLLFVIALSTALVILAISLSAFFISAIENFGSFTTDASEKTIHEYASYLLQKNVESTSQYYSSIFNKIAINSELIANESGKIYDLYQEKGGVNTASLNLKFKEGVGDVYFNNFSYKKSYIKF
jgi:hypothetical protein